MGHSDGFNRTLLLRIAIVLAILLLTIAPAVLQATTMPTITLNPAMQPVGWTVNINGTGFAANSPIYLIINGGHPPSSPITSDGSGAFNGSFVVPALPTGPAMVVASDGINSATAELLVAAVCKIDPEQQNVNISNTTTANIFIAGAPFLYAAEVHLKFDATRLQIVDADTTKEGIQIAMGHLFPTTWPATPPPDWMGTWPPPYDPYFIAQNSANNATGTIDFAITMLYPAPSIFMDSDLAVITFQAIGGGQANIWFENPVAGQPPVKLAGLFLQSGMPATMGIPATATPTPSPSPSPSPSPTMTGTPPPPEPGPIPVVHIPGVINVTTGPVPVANFTADVTSGVAPLTVHFTDTSTQSPDQWGWDFDNNGTVDSALQNPTYTYTSPGVYSVHLTAANANGHGTVLKNNFITVISAPTANFSADVTTGFVPLTVQFTDTSTGGPTSWGWDFNNDGTTDSTAKNPSHIYSAAGVYTVKLHVSNAAGSDDEIKNNLITVEKAVNVQAGTASIGAGSTASIPITIKGFDYTDGLGAYDIKIEFNSSVIRVDSVSGGVAPFDGNPVAGPTGFPGYVTLVGTQSTTPPGPTGEFIVAHLNITAIGNPGDNTVLDVTVNTLTRTGGEEPTGIPVDGSVTILKADFEAAPVKGAAPLAVQFTDKSLGTPSSWAWDFNNDGTVDSTVKIPQYTYTNGGTYTVKLSVTYSSLTLIATKTDYINVIKADFTADKTSGIAPLAVNFHDASTGTVNAWAWDFNNDGTVDSTAQNPSYTYTDTGTYTVKLTVSNTTLSISDEEVKTDYIMAVNYVAVTELAQYQDPTTKIIYLNVNIKQVKNPATGEVITLTGGLGAYDAEATFDSSGMQITSIAGVAPFDAPVTNVALTNHALFNATQTTATPQPPITVARLLPNLIGRAADSLGGAAVNYQLNVHFGTITAVGGEEVPEEAVQTMTFCRGNARVTATDKVNVTDALFIAQYLASLRPLSDLNAVNAASPKHDIGGDKITITDALYIAQYLASLRDVNYNLIT